MRSRARCSRRGLAVHWPCGCPQARHAHGGAGQRQRGSGSHRAVRTRVGSGTNRTTLMSCGGICSTNRSEQLYYAADALTSLPAETNTARTAERYCIQAVEAYRDTASQDWDFGCQACSHADLAIARLWRGEREGAAEALAPVLELPVGTCQRRHPVRATCAIASRRHTRHSGADREAPHTRTAARLSLIHTYTEVRASGAYTPAIGLYTAPSGRPRLARGSSGWPIEDFTRRLLRIKNLQHYCPPVEPRDCADRQTG